MSGKKTSSKKPTPFLNLELAAEAEPELEQIARELKRILNRLETLHHSFRQKFLKLFNDNEYLTPGDHGQSELRSLYFYHHANLGGHCLAHLRCAVEMADQTCDQLQAEIREGGEDLSTLN